MGGNGIKKGWNKMTAKTTTVSIRIDSTLKKKCEALFNSLGMSLNTAIHIFLYRSLQVGGIPFEVRLDQPNKETMAALLEAEHLAFESIVKRYSDVEEALTELKK